MDSKTKASQTEKPNAQSKVGFDGVAIGVLIGFESSGAPLVAYPENPSDSAVAARTTKAMSDDDLGCEVALLFEDGDPSCPMIIGRLLKPGAERDSTARQYNIERDGERVTIKADREIVLQCGKAKITLTRAGKILIRGAYVSSRSSGVNKIKGGSVQLN